MKKRLKRHDLWIFRLLRKIAFLFTILCSLYVGIFLLGNWQQFTDSTQFMLYEILMILLPVSFISAFLAFIGELFLVFWRASRPGRLFMYLFFSIWLVVLYLGFNFIIVFTNYTL